MRFARVESLTEEPPNPSSSEGAASTSGNAKVGNKPRGRQVPLTLGMAQSIEQEQTSPTSA